MSITTPPSVHSLAVTALLVIFGGASMFGSLAAPGTIQMGDRNVVASRQALNQAGIPLTGEAVGGEGQHWGGSEATGRTGLPPSALQENGARFLHSRD